MDVQALLRSLRLFVDPSAGRIERLSERLAEVSFPPGEIIFHEGVQAEAFSVMRECVCEATKPIAD